MKLPSGEDNMDKAKTAKKELIHGGDVYRNEVRLDFSVNLDPLPMPSSVKEAMLKGIGEIYQYPDPIQQELRAGIAAFEGISPENIVCGNGASELLMAAVHAVKPKKALIAAPCYAGYAVALNAADASVEEYFLDGEKDFALDEGFAGRITEGTDMVFIADPNNPNGKLIDPGLKKEIARRCEACGAALVIDECFYPLTEAGLTGNDYTDRALHLRAFTKTFAIPGIRLGYMVSVNDGLLSSIRKHLPEWNVSRIAERTGEAAAEVLAGYDGISLTQTLRPQLTTVRQKSEVLGEQAAKLLIGRLEQPGTAIEEVVTVPVELIKGSTVGWCDTW